jgi:hypothetical protein
MNLRGLLTLAATLSLASASVASLGACSTQANDEGLDAGTGDPLGSGLRIKQVMDPKSPDHPTSATASVNITGASFVWVDTFDETENGKSLGTVYLQDVGSSAPYSGASLYDPTYLPSNLKPAPGDVLDLTGEYDSETALGTATFPAGTSLIQISKPDVTFRFEYLVPPAALIDVNDLNDFNTGLQWSAMLVTVTNITLGSTLSNFGGRATAYLTSTISGSAVEISNELFDLETWNSQQPVKLTQGQTVKSLTGIVTWFDQYHIAPRTGADIVIE